MQEVLQEYGFSQTDSSVRSLGNGLINSTWLVTSGDKRYVLQKVNTNVFHSPEAIASNIRLLANYLREKHPDYLFISPLCTKRGEEMLTFEGGYYRLFPFVEYSHTIDVVEKPGQAFEAAKQFGKFSKLLSGLDPLQLKVTLPDFHNLSLRYKQFEDALENGNPNRIRESAELISFLQSQRHIVDEFEIIKNKFKVRCTHHDTKISNVLFNEQDRGLCVIDLDTVMPGYFISDVGDMMRTYLSPVSEEEKDLSKILIRPDFYQAIRDGYLSEMGAELNETERAHFHFAGLFMIYMQALRFLTDHLNNDSYYGTRYEGHNFIRAGNQAMLLQRLISYAEN